VFEAFAVLFAEFDASNVDDQWGVKIHDLLQNK
jgi:hypothetical protein